MRSDAMHRLRLAGTFFLFAACGAHAAPQVVGDAACERHAIDIAAFATCEDGRVVKPVAAEAAATGPAARAKDAAPPATRAQDARAPADRRAEARRPAADARQSR